MPKEDKYEEGFIRDNQFHRQLSSVRNTVGGTGNHDPDVELLIEEQKRAQREKQIEASLSGVWDTAELDKARRAGANDSEQTSVMEERRPVFSDNQYVDEFQSGVFKAPPNRAVAPDPGPVPRENVAATQIVKLNPGIYDEVAGSVYSFQHAMELARREEKRARKFNRPFSVCVASFHELSVIKEKLGAVAHEKALDFIGGMLIQPFDLDVEIVGRMSSDKFVIVLPEVSGQSVLNLFESVRKSFLDRPMTFKQFRFNLKPSLGVVFFPDHGFEYRELIAKADIVADMLVEQGGNGVAQMPIE